MLFSSLQLDAFSPMVAAIAWGRRVELESRVFDISDCARRIQYKDRR